MDIHTLHIEHVVLLALYTLLTVANSWLYKGMKGIHWFSLYNLFALLGAIAVAMRGQIPDFLSIVVGNLLVVAGYFLLYLSLSALFGRKLWQLYLHSTLVFVAVVTMLQYGWFQPSTPNRLIAYSFVLGLQQAHIALFLYRESRGPLRIATGSMAFMLATLSIANFIRIMGVGHWGAPRNYLTAGPFLAWIVIVNSCLQGGAMVAYVWMTAALLRRELEVQASTDPLTGLLNRRALELAAEEHILNGNRTHSPISAIVLDLDGFKRVNDSFGHHCGDAMLLAISSCLQRAMRPQDLLARIGGDEFAILLPDTTYEGATEIANRLRVVILSTEIVYGRVQTSVSASFGVAQLQQPATSWEHLFMRCDKALYEEKRSETPMPSEPPQISQELDFLTS